jgi:hypothetical protein
MQLKSRYAITGSSVYGLEICDGYILGKLLFPNKKSIKSFISKGKKFHSIMEEHSKNEVLLSELIADEKEDIKALASLIAERSYYPNLVKGLAEYTMVVDAFSKDQLIALAGTIDNAIYYPEENHLVILDYKTSQLVAAKDVEQLKTYVCIAYILCVQIGKILGIDEEKALHMEVSGLLDYVHLDKTLNVIMTRESADQHVDKVFTYVSNIEKLIIDIENGNNPRVEYGSGDICNLCTFLGVCPEYKKAVSASVDYLDNMDEHAVFKDPKVIYAEYEQVKDLIKKLEKRSDALSKSLVSQGEAAVQANAGNYKLANNVNNRFQADHFSRKFMSYMSGVKKPDIILSGFQKFLDIADYDIPMKRINELPESLQEIAKGSYTQMPTSTFIRRKKGKKEESNAAED